MESPSAYQGVTTEVTTRFGPSVPKWRPTCAKKCCSVKGMKLPPEVLTDDEVEKLVAVCSRRAPSGVRNRAILQVLHRGMLRIDEALSLRPADVDLKDGSIRVRHGNGDKARTIGIPQSTCDAIELWLGVRKNLGVKGARSSAGHLRHPEIQPRQEARLILHPTRVEADHRKGGDRQASPCPWVPALGRGSSAQGRCQCRRDQRWTRSFKYRYHEPLSCPPPSRGGSAERQVG